MKNSLLFISLVILYSSHSHAQTKEKIEIVPTGATIVSKDKTQFELYEQYRGVFFKKTISPSISILTGLNYSSIENKDFLEFPLLFQYQFSPRLKASGGSQFEMVRDRETGIFTVRGVSFSTGVDYQFTENWDAGIQFVLPIIKGKAFESSSPFVPNPIRLRTGFKF
ncbi:hypothetical protein GCM10011344_22630 [Dokdonia pacifica]|uniref:Outer membrane protein beta-barrel domain-containing protein n=1 Tax=Dokdonia pacifica TaxID=1627892 RepID=A0A238WHU3_9FLAO|nr:hypothetical protein [Dokdonia pacifica]GGG21322.1 hypothetical protein GCM10011344_22630 [Dokdonia pacifica]SNR46122.1 hypothetical protein SAMN06265376_1011094 [Dokdonia pacifica]